MERSLKRWKHLWRQKIMAFIYPWQGCWGCGSQGQGLHAPEFATVWSIVNPLQYPVREPTCVAFDWISAWVGVMGLKKVTIVLCWWPLCACIAVLQQLLLVSLERDQSINISFMYLMLEVGLFSAMSCQFIYSNLC